MIVNEESLWVTSLWDSGKQWRGVFIYQIIKLFYKTTAYVKILFVKLLFKLYFASECESNVSMSLGCGSRGSCCIRVRRMKTCIALQVWGETHSWQEETCHWMFWEQLVAQAAFRNLRYADDFSVQILMKHDALLYCCLNGLIRTQTSDLTWQENVLKANAMQTETLLGVLKRFWLISWAFLKIFL